MISFDDMNRQLLAVSGSLLPEWLPGGKWQGHEYICASLDGGEGGSLSVNANTGKWGDFATTDLRGGDLVSLYAMIHGLSQFEALKALAGEELPTKSNGHYRGTDLEKHDEPEVQAHTPPNVNFEASLFRHRTLGVPSHFWVYRDADTTPMHVVARYPTPDGGKAVLPWLFDGLKWVNKGPPAPRPLYGLDRLASIEGRPLIVEGEKTADAAQFLFPKRPCISWMGGVGQVGSADLTPLHGKGVTIWPDNDEPGKGAAAKLAAKLFKAGCEVTIIDPSGFEEGWDLADALAAGTPAAQLREYAKAHTKAVEPPKPKEVPKSAPQALERVQTVAQGEVLENRPRPGSMIETWQRHGFVTKSTGKPYCNYVNVGKAIEAHGDLDVYYDTFTQRVMVGDNPWTSHETRRLAVWLQGSIGMSEVTVKTVDEGVLSYAFQRQRNPVQEWINSLTWDGEERIYALLPVGMGVKDTEYARAVGRCFMVGIVARALSPGCKVDCMPVFEGNQGVGKSTALKILGGKYFSEIHESINSKDFYIAITGKLICEISELGAFRRAEIEKVKGILSTATDRYRAPYDRVADDHPRSCVFAGTTNLDDWNADDTGARRFWPVRCGIIDRQWLTEHREQLFAEAVHLYRQGEDWWSVPNDQAERQRTARQQVDPWYELIRSYIEPRPWVTIPGILSDCLEIKKQDVSIMEHKRVAGALKQLSWRMVFKFVDGKTERRWVRKDSPL